MRPYPDLTEVHCSRGGHLIDLVFRPVGLPRPYSRLSPDGRPGERCPRSHVLEPPVHSAATSASRLVRPSQAISTTLTGPPRTTGDELR